MTPTPMTFRQRWKASMGMPPPDSPGGIALAVGFGLGLVYVLFLVADYSAMAAAAWWVTSLSLVLAAVAAFSLATMLGGDIATYQRLELDLARTVLAYIHSGSAPPSDAPLAGIWRAYVGAAEESRRVARAHAYALGVFVAASVLALGAALISGLGTITVTENVNGLAMLVETFAFFFLVVGAGAILSTLGYSGPVPGFAAAAARRWRRNAGRAEAVQTAYGDVPWLAEFARSASESRIEPSGPSVLPSWRE